MLEQQKIQYLLIRKATQTPYYQPITNHRKQKIGKALDQKEMQDFKSVIGQISWLARISQPDLTFENCILSTSQTKATVNDLVRANKVLRSAKNHEY